MLLEGPRVEPVQGEIVGERDANLAVRDRRADVDLIDALAGRAKFLHLCRCNGRDGQGDLRWLFTGDARS